MDTSTKHLAARYDAAAKNWQQKIAPLGYPEAYAEMLAGFGPANANGLSVLDAGTGCADFSFALVAQKGLPKSLTLCDISADMLKLAKQRLQGAGVQAVGIVSDLESLPNTQKYDLILCAHVIEHCPNPTTALSALRGQLAEGGKLFLVASKPHWCTALIRLIWRNKAYSPAKMQAFLVKAGFGDIKLFSFTSGPPSRTSMGYIATLKVENDDRCSF